MSQNAAVRNFANMLIADHTRLSQAVAAAATSARLTPPPPALLPPQQAMLDQLRAAGAGPDFDLAFQQGADHCPPAGAAADAELRRERRRPGAAHGCGAGDPDRSRCTSTRRRRCRSSAAAAAAAAADAAPAIGRRGRAAADGSRQSRQLGPRRLAVEQRLDVGDRAAAHFLVDGADDPPLDFLVQTS